MSRARGLSRVALALALLLGGLAAAPGCSVAEELKDYPCPSRGTKLTYQSFGEPFFAANCVYCHGGPNGYSSRAFNTLDSIRASEADIFRNAAGTNAFMPPGPDGPTAAQRDQLAEWLACGAPGTP